MEYRLNWTEAIKAVFISKNIFVTLLFIGLILILPIVIVISILPLEEPILLGVILATVVVPLPLLAKSAVNSGWSINGGQFNLKAFKSKQLTITDMEIELVPADSQWRPTMRTFGAGLAGLLIGDCRLKNKKTALVFQHLGNSQLLVIKANDDYCIVSHPGVEKLYRELLKLGAKEIKLEAEG